MSRRRIRPLALSIVLLAVSAPSGVTIRTSERRDDLFYQVTRGWLGIAASL